jgi:hypothetical protein
MSSSAEIKGVMQAIIQRMMDQVMQNVLIHDPFIPEKHRAAKPLYAALVPEEIFKAAHFERRFVTPFGKAWERLAVEVARAHFGQAQVQYTISGTVKAERLRRITEILNTLEHPRSGKERVRPSWERELNYVLQGDGERIPVSVLCDVYVSDLEGQKFAVELKAPLPNSDQCKVSKEKLLKLFAMEERPIEKAFFALPYNPYGARDQYNWSFPARWFDMRHDPVVLIGDEFWDWVGGIGTYQVLVEAVNDLGAQYKDRIYKEFFGIVPPTDGLSRLT